VAPRCQGAPARAPASTLTQAFWALVRGRQGDALAAWIADALTSGIAAWARVAHGLQGDLAAVKAGLTRPWRHGPVAGHMNRLTWLTRQRSGRAGCACGRPRVLQPAS